VRHHRVMDVELHRSRPLGPGRQGRATGARGPVRPGLLVLVVVLLGALLAGYRSGTSTDVDIGARSTVLGRLEGGAPLKFGKERSAFYVVAFPEDSVATALTSYSSDVRPALDLGVLALSVRSPHRGVRVAWCRSSGWFEDPAYGQKFSRVGERMEGPAPRGMDLYPVRLRRDGHLVVSTRTVVSGVPMGTRTVDPEPHGPRCVT
jgi:hypothetical protein